MVRRTAERIPSLPTTKSHVAVVPSLKLSVMGSVGEVSEYDTKRFAKWILSPESRCLARSCWRTDLWKVCAVGDRHFVSQTYAPPHASLSGIHTVRQVNDIDRWHLVALSKPEARTYNPTERVRSDDVVM